MVHINQECTFFCGAFPLITETPQMAGNKSLQQANKAKKDEFYTQRVDIENELKHYRKHFKDKIVLCNCDDPFESNFFKYFAMNFNHLGLKKLIATCYDGSPILSTELPLFGTCEKLNRIPFFIHQQS